MPDFKLINLSKGNFKSEVLYCTTCRLNATLDE